MAELKLPFPIPTDQNQLYENLETMRQFIQDLDTKVESFTNIKVGNGTFETDSDGNVIQTLQPNCLITMSASQSTSDTATVAFDTEIYDQNGDFNTSTYTFTAPVDGRYLVIVNLKALYSSIGGARDIFAFSIVTSNRTYQVSDSVDSTGEDITINQMVTYSAVVDLDENDTVFCNISGLSGAGTTNIDNTVWWLIGIPGADPLSAPFSSLSITLLN